MRQRTFAVDGEKITIKTRAKTHLGNLQGFGVNINGQQFNIFNVLTREEAEDKAFVKWVKGVVT